MEGDRDRVAEAVCEAMADSLFTVGPDGTITFANSRLLGVTGLDREALVGSHHERLASFTGGDYGAFEDALDAVLDGAADERRVDVLADSPVAGEVPVELRITALPGGDGALVVMRDVSERAAYEAELERTSDQLSVLNRLLRHDIRNDAAVMAGWGEHLADELEDPEQVAAVERIRAAATHIVELTREARDVEAMITDEGEMDLSPVALAPVLERELEKTRTRFPAATVVEPDSVPDATVTANRLVGTVFGNLLTNAVQHNDGEAPTVAVAVEREGEAVAVTVADDGPGVPPERREALFDRGEKRLDSMGSGMGLYLVDTLVHQYGGDVAVGDAPDLGGAAFTVRLPVAE